MGKTAFALNLAMRAAMQGGATIAIFSLEMSKESLMDRMLCAWGRVDMGRVRRAEFLDDSDWKKLADAADDLSRAKIFIDDTAALTPLALRARCRRLKAEHGLDMVLVDYLQLMHSSRNESRELEISDISRNLKALAKELKIPVIALSQLNRKVEERTDKRPVLSDLRESGAIEQDAESLSCSSIVRINTTRRETSPRPELRKSFWVNIETAPRERWSLPIDPSTPLLTILKRPIRLRRKDKVRERRAFLWTTDGK